MNGFNFSNGLTRNNGLASMGMNNPFFSFNTNAVAGSSSSTPFVDMMGYNGIANAGLGNNTTNPSMWEKFMGGVKGFGEFMNSDAGKGIMGGAGLALGIMDGIKGWNAYKQNMKTMKLQREAAQYNLDRTRKENQRLDNQRADMTNSWKNGAVI